MKVTIYTLTSDSDDGMTTEIFGTRVAMLKAKQAAIASYMPKWLKSWPVPVDGNMTCDELESALQIAWEKLTEKIGFMDSLSSEAHEVEIDLPEPYKRLHDIISDCVERPDGPINEANLPDDHAAIVQTLTECVGAQ